MESYCVFCNYKLNFHAKPFSLYYNFDAAAVVRFFLFPLELARAASGNQLFHQICICLSIGGCTTESQTNLLLTSTFLVFSQAACMLTFYPVFEAESIQDMEVVFLLDVSCSMKVS